MAAFTCAPAGNDTALHVAAWKGKAEVFAALVAAGAAIGAENDNRLCSLTLAASWGFTAIVQQALSVWSPPVAVLKEAAAYAARGSHWQPFVVLVKELSRSDRQAVKQLCKQHPGCAPALLTALLLDSPTEKQQAALLNKERELAQQRLGVQQLILSVAGMQKRAAAAAATVDAPPALAAVEENLPPAAAASGPAAQDRVTQRFVPSLPTTTTALSLITARLLVAVEAALALPDSKRQRVG